MRFGIRDITDVVFKARNEVRIGNQTFKPGQPVLYIDTAKTATLEGTATQVFAQGGRGNPRLVGWEGERTITFTLEDALLSPVSFAMLTGAGLSNVASAGSKNKVKVNTWFELPIKAGGVVEIDLDTAGDNHDIYIDNEDYPVYGTILDNAGAPVVYCENTSVSGVEPNCNVYTITKDNKLVLGFTDASKYVGAIMRVDCYVEKTGGVTRIIVDAENFSGNYYVEAQTFFREQDSGLDMPVVISFPNVKIQSNFTFNMSNTGDPSTFTFTMDCFPAYIKGDYSHKMFFCIDMVADETIHPDEETVEEECPELTTTFTEVVAGAADWDTKEFPGDPKKINFLSLGNNLSATVDRANVDFSGNLKRIDDWTAYDSNKANLTGYYFPVALYAEDGYKLKTINSVGASKELVFGQTGDGAGRINMIWGVDPNAPVTTVVLSDATGANSQEFSFDFSKCVFK